MNLIQPLACIPVGVVVERRKAASSWAEFIWRPVEVFVGLPAAVPWTMLSTEAEATVFYAGPAEIELYRSDAERYRENLRSGAPSVWVALRTTGGEWPYEVSTVTADPAEGEGLSVAGQGIIEAVAMCEPLRDAIAAFVAEHFVEIGFTKRVRDCADPEALARRGPLVTKRR